MTWKEFQEIRTVDPILEKRKILFAFLAVTQNKHVDILGHPNFLPHGRIIELFEPNDFIPVLEGLSKSGQAWEINLSHSYLDPRNGDYVVSIIDDSANIKKYRKADDVIYLLSESKSQKDYPLSSLIKMIGFPFRRRKK